MSMSSLIPRLPDSLQSYLAESSKYIQHVYTTLPPPVQQSLESAASYTHLDQVPPTAIASAAAVLLVSVISMSRWGGFPSWGNHGARLSPFGRSQYPPHVSDEDFSYITSADLASPPRTYDPYGQPPPSMQAEDDVLLIKNKGVTYPVKFPAYSIGDGKLQVGDIKRRATIVMGLPDGAERRLKLLYKGQQLKDDGRPCRDYHLKNESEVLCIVGEPIEGSDDSDGSDIAQDSSGKKKRVRHKKKKRSKKDGRVSPGQDGTSEASGTTSPTPGDGAMDKLNAISSHFHVKLLPLCVQFTATPPTDPKKKDFEHKKLSETIMNEVMLKLDAVETDGVPEVREKRRALVRETQGVLDGLDKAMK